MSKLLRIRLFILKIIIYYFLCKVLISNFIKIKILQIVHNNSRFIFNHLFMSVDGEKVWFGPKCLVYRKLYAVL